ncbi:hypothetical protein KR200_001348 [Drosophila serrata]|nr:hypothetical protein KR200_001348 [Drosophila serrata]
MHQASDPLKEPQQEKSTPDVEASKNQGRVAQRNDAPMEPQKTASQPTTISLSPQTTKTLQYSKPPQQKSEAKPTCQSTSSVSDQEGTDITILSNVVVPPAVSFFMFIKSPNSLSFSQIIDEDAILPAHMPVHAIDLKSPSKVPSEDKEEKEDEQGEGMEKEKDEDEGRPNSTENGIIRENNRSMYKSIFSIDEEEDEQLLAKQMGFVLNDLEAEEQLIDDVMDLTRTVGGEEGDKDALDMDIDLDLLVKDDNMTNQMALIDPQPDMSFDQCLEAIDTKLNSPKRAPSSIDHQLTNAAEFIEELSNRPPVDVNADKSNLMWPFMDEDEVLDYEADNDVLTLVVSSDELDDEDPSKSPKPELQPKGIDKPEIPNAEKPKNFRIPRINPELLQAQPSVMHSLYLHGNEERNGEKITQDVRLRREEARIARRPKESMPRFAPPYRQTREDYVPKDLPQPLFGPQDLAPPQFGPDDLAPICAPPNNREETNYRQPLVASQYSPGTFIPNSEPLGNRDFLAEVPHQRHPPGASQYVPQNLTTSCRNTCPAEVPLLSHQGIGAKHWMMEIFGVKCLRYLENKCLVANCDHTLSPVGEVERRLLSMPEESLVHTYRQALRSSYIFQRYFKCFANIFERRKLGKHLLQMLVNSRLYRNLTVHIVEYVFSALKRSGLEREATNCMMTDLWMPDKAHKFSELTLAILNILKTVNWQDYIDQLVELHETHKFLLSDELMVRIMKWADVTKNEALQKKAMMMLLADMGTYSRSPTLMSLVDRFSNPDPNPNLHQLRAGSVPALPRISPAQQQLIPQQDRLLGVGSSPSLLRRFSTSGHPQPFPASNWNLPGAGPGPSLIRSNPALTPHWTHTASSNAYRDLPGAGPGPSLIRNSPLLGHHQEQQEYLTSLSRSQGDNGNRADDPFCNYRSSFQ